MPQAVHPEPNLHRFLSQAITGHPHPESLHPIFVFLERSIQASVLSTWQDSPEPLPPIPEPADPVPPYPDPSRNSYFPPTTIQLQPLEASPPPEARKPLVLGSNPLDLNPLSDHRG